MHPKALIKFGLHTDDEFDGKIQVDVIITGVEAPKKVQSQIL